MLTLNRIISVATANVPMLDARGVKEIAHTKPHIADIILSVRKRRLSYLPAKALAEIAQAVIDVERANPKGIMIETGCALGGSALTIAAAKSPRRTLKIYDTFGMIPPPSKKDGEDVLERYDVIQSGRAKGFKGQQYYGYKQNLLQEVRDTFAEHGFQDESVEFIPGLYQDTLNIREPVCFAHIDCDWYTSVLLSLQNIEPRLVEGGIIVIDDYHAWSGCRRAVDEYFEKRTDVRFLHKSRLHIIKQHQNVSP